jgi:hypothetical protein
MRITAPLIIFTALSHSLAAIAGAWGIGPFENDDALDFVSQLQEYDSYRAIWLPFGDIIDSDTYIDATIGAQTIAAAEVVAALRGKSRPALPDDLANWVKSKNWSGDVKLVGTAEMCLKKVLDPSRSELAQLWKETDQYDAWLAAGEELLKDLR